MNESIFSYNELLYLKNIKNMKKSSSNNYIYQIRHGIKKKISNFIINDIDMLLKFQINNPSEKKILDDDLYEFLVMKIMKMYPYFILKILNLEDVKHYLGE